MGGKIKIIDSKEKPRVRFCHECGRKLYGNHHVIVKKEGIDHDFILHKDCAKKMKEFK
jgi:hypothetical protein